MKNLTKNPKLTVSFGFIALITLIAFAMTACEDPTGSTDPCDSGHDFQFTSTTAPTCIDEGFDLYTCSRTPSVTEQRNPVAKLGHLAPDGTPATCTVDGNTGTGTCTRENCTETVTGETLVALGHEKTAEPFAVVDPTCTVDGTKTYRCIRFDDCDHTFPEEKGENALEHLFQTFTSNNNATCEEDGTETAICARDNCDETHTQTEADSALGHLHQTYTSNNNATCEEDGTETAICARDNCDEPHTRTEADSALGHDHFESLVCKRIGCDHQYALGNIGPAGGRIFYIADGIDGRPLGFTVTGYGTEGQTGYFATYTAHYLEVAPTNANTTNWRGSATNYVEIPAGTGITTLIWPLENDPLRNTIGNGRKDTQIIIAFYAEAVENGSHPTLAITDTAANYAFIYRAPSPYNTIDDWFLPSSGELNLLYQSTSAVSNMPTSGMFWSSSQFNFMNAWYHDFSDDLRSYWAKQSSGQLSVRAVRVF